MPKITFRPGGQSFEVAAGTTILTAAVRGGLHLPHECTEAICGTDRVTVISGQENLSDKTDNEELTLEMLSAGEHERLACAAQILGDVEIEVSAS